MIRRLPLAALLLAGCTSAGPSGDGFVPLFNGRDLEGWQAAPGHAWIVEDGVIALRGKTRPRSGSGGARAAR